jgi:hypothetical protein
VLLLWTFVAATSLLMSVAMGYGAWRRANAPEANAEIVAIDDVRDRVTVRFVDASGRSCEAAVLYDATGQGTRVGDRIAVRYTRDPSCSNVRASSDSTWWLSVFIPLAFLAAALVALVRLRRRAAHSRAATLRASHDPPMAPMPRPAGPLACRQSNLRLFGYVGGTGLMLACAVAIIAAPLVGVDVQPGIATAGYAGLLLGLWGAYWFWWRLAYKLEVTATTLKWSSLLRRGQIPLDELWEIAPTYERPWAGYPELVRFRVERGASVLVMDFDTLSQFVDEVKRRAPHVRRQIWRSLDEVDSPEAEPKVF